MAGNKMQGKTGLMTKDGIDGIGGKKPAGPGRTGTTKAAAGGRTGTLSKVKAIASKKSWPTNQTPNRRGENP